MINLAPLEIIFVVVQQVVLRLAFRAEQADLDVGVSACPSLGAGRHLHLIRHNCEPLATLCCPAAYRLGHHHSK